MGSSSAHSLKPSTPFGNFVGPTIAALGAAAFLMFGATISVETRAQSSSSAVSQSPTDATLGMMDSLWEKRHEQHERIASFVKAKPKLADDYEVLWRVARLVYYAGFFSLADEASKTEKMEIFKWGADAADKARKLDPKRVEAHYWYAVDYGGYGLNKGIMASLGGAEGMRQALDEAVKIDPRYHFGGPLRVRGRLYFKLPGGFISFGDNKKALTDLKKAVEVAPESKLNYIYLTEVQAKSEGDGAAIKTLEKAKTVPDIVGPVEEASYRRDLAEIEKKLR